MNRDALQKLRLDRRLLARRGWMSDAELERELAALPDVAAKGTTLGNAADEREAPAGSTRSAGEPGATQ
ncbi:MAG TPA: hypothetical protein VMS55_10825 [Myxococcota bacterium]|nr:hypothetical protein [Myxococcota bacterium]